MIHGDFYDIRAWPLCSISNVKKFLTCKYLKLRHDTRVLFGLGFFRIWKIWVFFIASKLGDFFQETLSFHIKYLKNSDGLIFFSFFTLQIWNNEYLGIFLSDVFLFVCPHLVFPVTLNLKYTLGLVITNTFTPTLSLEQLNGLNFPLIQMQKMNFYFEGVSVTCCTPSPPTSRRLCTPGTQLILSTSSKNTIPDKNKCKRLKSIEWQWQNADI